MGRHYFDHYFIDKFDIVRDDENLAGRHYHTPAGYFPSVTTVLAKAKGEAWLDEWRKSIGEDKAKKITTQAKNRGTQLHTLLENYVMNKDDWAKTSMPSALENFLRIKPWLDNCLDSVMGSEFGVYSGHYKTAGTIDLIGRWKGKPSILDLKTARRCRKREQYTHYFVQAAVYALMLNELLEYPTIEQVVILMLADDQPLPYIWEAPVAQYEPLVNDIFVRNAVAPLG